MYTKIEPFLLYAMSSVHAGSGSEVGLVDLPVQREKHTGFPKIDSSSLKGAIRSTVENALRVEDEPSKFHQVSQVFGSAPKEAQSQDDAQAGAIAFADARILLFPVRSLRGVFAWVTCPFVLTRFNRELQWLPSESAMEPLPVPEVNTVSSLASLAIEDKVVLEEYTFEVKQDDLAHELAQRIKEWMGPEADPRFEEKLVVIGDDDFNDFVQLSTEVNARIKIDAETQTAQGQALWYEENVPPESIFYSFLFAGHVRGRSDQGLVSDDDVIRFIKNEDCFPRFFQLGGNSTLGRGILHRIWILGGCKDVSDRN